jgi:membrane protease YdiL (CAAX protease family)
MKKDLAIALSAYTFLLALSFVMSILLGMGRAESLHDPASFWMYGRRLLMIVFAMVVPWLRGKDTLAACGWKVSLPWLLCILGVGVLFGNFNPGGFDPRLPVSILLALFHSFATELFFRRYLFKTFENYFTRSQTAVILSAILYGFYYLTVWKTFEKPGLGRCIFIVILFTVLGTIFAYSYKKSKSFLVPWLMHFFSVLNFRLLY